MIWCLLFLLLTIAVNSASITEENEISIWNDDRFSSTPYLLYANIKNVEELIELANRAQYTPGYNRELTKKLNQMRARALFEMKKSGKRVDELVFVTPAFIELPRLYDLIMMYVNPEKLGIFSELAFNHMQRMLDQGSSQTTSLK